MPNATARIRGRNCLAIRTPPDWGPDIFLPLLLTFDSGEDFGQRYIRAGFPFPDWRMAYLLRGRAPPEGGSDGIPNAFVTSCGPRGPAGRHRRRRLIRVHQSRQPLPLPPLPSLRRPDRVLFPRDRDDLPVPPPGDRRLGVASPEGICRACSVSRVRTVARRSDHGGPGGPPPDRAHAEAVAEGDRLRRRPAEGGGRRSFREPDASDPV